MLVISIGRLGMNKAADILNLNKMLDERRSSGRKTGNFGQLQLAVASCTSTQKIRRRMETPRGLDAGAGGGGGGGGGVEPGEEDGTSWMECSE